MTAPTFQVSEVILGWPDPGPDGITRVPAELAASLMVLLANVADYIETQYARCRAD